MPGYSADAGLYSFVDVLFVGERVVDRRSDKIVQGNIVDGGENGGLFVEVGWDSDVEGAFVGFVRFLSQVFTGLEIVIDCLVKVLFELFYRGTFEVDEVVDA